MRCIAKLQMCDFIIAANKVSFSCLYGAWVCNTFIGSINGVQVLLILFIKMFLLIYLRCLLL